MCWLGRKDLVADDDHSDDGDDNDGDSDGSNDQNDSDGGRVGGRDSEGGVGVSRGRNDQCSRY